MHRLIGLIVALTACDVGREAPQLPGSSARTARDPANETALTVVTSVDADRDDVHAIEAADGSGYPVPATANVYTAGIGDLNGDERGVMRSYDGTVVVGSAVWDNVGRSDQYRAVAVTADGVYVAGKTQGEACAGVANVGRYDVMVHRWAHDAFGQGAAGVLDCFAFGSTGNDEATGLDLGAGQVFVAGATASELCGPIDNNPGDLDVLAFGVKANNLQQKKWCTRFGSTEFDEAQNATFDEVDSALYVTGMTRGDLCASQVVGRWRSLRAPVTCVVDGAIDADPMVETNPVGGGDGLDAFVARFVPGPQGAYQLDWVYQFGTALEDNAQDVAIHHGAVTHLYVTGRTNGALEIGYPNGPNPADGRQYSDAYLIRIELDATGLAVSNTVIDQWGGELQDVGMQVGIDTSSQKVVVAGGFDSGRDHGASPAICTTEEAADAFVYSFAIGAGPGAAPVDRWVVDGGHADLMQAVAIEGGQAHVAGLSANAAPPVGGPPKPPGLPGCSDSFIGAVTVPP